jgi:hypothetical protein
MSLTAKFVKSLSQTILFYEFDGKVCQKFEPNYFIL